MPLDKDGRWSAALFPRQMDLMRACAPSKKNLVLASGPRWASKTVGALNALVQHGWNTDRGNIALIAMTQSVGVDSGIWTDLTEVVIPDWISGDFGMEWKKKPYIQNVTKKPACQIINRHGNVTKFQLDSLKNEDEVEDRYKGKRYSAIFINELSKFTKRKTFDTLKQALRMLHLKEEDHLLLADTNPAEEGSQSWIYKLWYEFRVAEPDQFKAIFPDFGDVPVESLLPMRDALNLIEFTIDDNLACSPAKKASLMADFAHDEDLFQRYFYGKWVTASSDAIFNRVFRPKFHVVRDLMPETGCFELATGHDPGGTNYGAVIGEKFIPDIKQYPKYQGKPVFKCLQEQVVIGEDFELYDFVEQFVKKMDYWEGMIGRQGKTVWTHWSDRSVFDMKIPFLDRYWASEILMASDNRLRLIAAARGKGSVEQRIQLVRKLLFEERLFVDEEYCPNVIEMFKSMKRGTTQAAGIARGSRFKHIFDGLSYWLASECVDELAMSMMNKVRGSNENQTSLVQNTF